MVLVSGKANGPKGLYKNWDFDSDGKITVDEVRRSLSCLWVSVWNTDVSTHQPWLGQRISAWLTRGEKVHVREAVDSFQTSKIEWTKQRKILAGKLSLSPHWIFRYTKMTRFFVFIHQDGYRGATASDMAMTFFTPFTDKKVCKDIQIPLPH